ncbi:MAG: type II secretion system protein [Alphaproteobacteria bacterium]|nr:type II secretion system protein [Alphaproteobacteria bacterium]
MVRTAEKGFTLIELSMVLVIIALLAGGVTVGASLIKNAEIRAVVREVEQFRSAFNTFDLQYNGVPGDFAEAYDFFSTKPNCISAVNCNGDGDGKIEASAVNDTDESLKVWIHLVAADIVPGSYNGTAVLGVPVLGTNVPESKQGTSGYYAEYGTDSFAKNNVLRFGRPTGVSTIENTISPDDARNIDSKIDDGLPASGNVHSTTASTANCQDGTKYLIDKQVLECGLSFRID